MSNAKKIIIGIGLVSLALVGVVYAGKLKNSTGLIGQQIMKGKNALSSNLMPLVPDVTAQGIGILDPLTQTNFAGDLNLQGVKPETKFSSIFPEINTFVSNEFEQKLNASLQDQKALEERQRVLAGTIQVTPQKRDGEGYTAFDRRVLSSTKYQGSVYSAV